jgi:AcrR family transcriptional regulator
MARPRQADREEVLTETRQRLLTAAATEFANKGYVGANVNHISKSAGFAKGTIYNYFPSKRALMLALIDEAAVAHTDYITQRVQSEEEPARRLERFFSAGAAFVEGHPAQAQVMINAVYGPDEEFRARVYQAYEPLFTLIIQDIVEAGIAQGDFRAVDSDLVTVLIMTVYLGSSSQLDDAGKIWIDFGQIVELILDGLRPREAAKK